MDHLLEQIAAIIAIATGVGMFKREHLRNWFTLGRFVLSVAVVVGCVWALVILAISGNDISHYTRADILRTVIAAVLLGGTAFLTVRDLWKPRMRTPEQRRNRRVFYTWMLLWVIGSSVLMLAYLKFGVCADIHNAESEPMGYSQSWWCRHL
ncbi:hypothetical protein AWB81_01779 [Caballeronia arationis]|uniref:hypothetical protein n=1 Tax=Caballeronia arationis TaxID=1777142 RepID=UPI00074BD58C|nr:hypothetical protein [Caballeronia arationis]SAK59009.1 hypothetical protein AWB81_01779 [Caballeronia arationis]